VPAVLATAPLVGELTGTEQLHLTIGLPVRNQAALDQYLKEIYDPHNAQHGHYLKKGEFGRMYGASQSDYEAVVQFAKANGLKVDTAYGSHILVAVSGASADIQKAFHVKLHYYERPDGSRFRAPENEPSVDLAVPLSHISGLDDYLLPNRNQHQFTPLKSNQKSLSLSKTGADSILGSGPGGAFVASDFRTAYAAGTTLTGTGQTVAIFARDGFYQSDITAYENQTGLPNNIPIVPVPIDWDGNASESPVKGVVTEVELDIEMAIAMAPGLSQVLVYEGEYPIIADNAVFAQIAEDDAASQINCSYSFGIDPIFTSILEMMAAQNQSFFASAGDDGGYTAANPVNNVFIVDQPLVTVVGGTSLEMNGNGSSYLSESGWADGGGGISTDFPIPSYQTAVAGENGASGTWRDIPDVAMAADKIFVVTTTFDANGNATYNVPGAIVGTSASTPLWTGFMALINQQRTQNGLQPMGFANPALYAVFQGPNYNADFHDVTTGGNGPYNAGVGYDLVTGLGSPNGQNLINDLCPDCVRAPLAPTATVTNTPIYTYTAKATPTSGTCLNPEGRFNGVGGEIGLASPAGIALDRNGNVYVADEANSNVQRFAPNGTPISITYGNGKGGSAGQLFSPEGVALDSFGNVFVSSAGNNFVNKFDANGNLMATFGLQGTVSPLNFPLGMACDSQNNLYVADWNNNRVVVFDDFGDYVGVIGSAGTGKGQMSHPSGVAVDGAGNIYVSDTGNNRIDVFNSSYAPVAQWGGTASGTGQGQFNSPNQLAFAGPGLQFLFVADGGNKRVQIFNTSGVYQGQISGFNLVNPFGVAGDGSRLYISDNGAGDTGVLIFDVGNCTSIPQNIPLTLTPTMTQTPTITSTAIPTCVGGVLVGVGVYGSNSSSVPSADTVAVRVNIPNSGILQSVQMLGNDSGLPRQIGIYDDDGTGNHPTNLLASASYIDQNFTVMTVALNMTMTAGYKWLAISSAPSTFSQPSFTVWNPTVGTTGSAVIFNGQMPAKAVNPTAFANLPALGILFCPQTNTPTSTPTTTPTSLIACRGGGQVGPVLNTSLDNPIVTLNNEDTYAVQVNFSSASVIKAIQVYGTGTGLEQKIGVYDDHDGPSVLLGSTTNVDGAVGAVETVPLNLEVSTGVKWLAISSDVGAGRRGHPTVFKAYNSIGALLEQAVFAGQMPVTATNITESGTVPIAISALYCPACVLTGTRWSQTTSSYIGGPRELMGTAVYNGLMWTIGGRSPLGDSGDCDFSSDGINWYSATPFGPMGGREGQVLLTFDPGDGQGERLFAIGGSRYPGNTFTGSPTNTYSDVWSSFDGANWTQVTSKGGFTAGAPYVGTVFNNKMWLIGGGTFPNTNKVWSSSDGITWTPGVTLEGSQTAQALLVNNGEMVVIENGYRNYPTFGNFIFSSTDGSTWNPITKNPASGFGNRSGFSGLSAWGELWVIGGTILGQTAGQDQLMNDVWSSTNGADWKQATDNASFNIRQNAGAFNFNGQLWILGGMTNQANTPNNGFGYTSDVWTTYCLEGPVTVRGGVSGGLLGSIVNQVGHLMGLSFNLSNTGTDPLNLSQVEVRYWFNSTCGTPDIRAWVQGRAGDTGRRDNNNGGLIQTSLGSLSPGSAIQYISFKFNNGNLPVGNQITIGAVAIFAQNALANCALSAVPNGNQLTIYENGTLVQGQEPTGLPATPMFSPTYSPINTPTISPTQSPTPSSTATLTKTVTSSPTVLFVATPTPTCPFGTNIAFVPCGPTATPTTQTVLAALVVSHPSTSTPTLTPTQTATSTEGSGLVLSAVMAPHSIHGGKPVKLLLTLAGTASVQWTITSSAGEKIYQTTILGQAGLNTLTWSGLNQAGLPVGDGVYTYVIQAQEGLNQTVTQGRIFVRR